MLFDRFEFRESRITKTKKMDVTESYENPKTDFAAEYDEIKRRVNFENELQQMEKEIEYYKMKQLSYQKECQEVEMERQYVNRLKNIGLFDLKNMQIQKNGLCEDLTRIHENYVNCATKVNRYVQLEDAVSKKIEELTAERDRLKETLEELRVTRDEKRKELQEIRTSIKIQENKNLALLRKLKKLMERRNITEELREKINTVMNDPRMPKADYHDQNPV